MSKKKRLAESLEMVLVVEPNIDIVTDNMVAEWSSTPYPQLSVLLVYLRHLSFIHQNHHWVSKGEPFYGDHLLFQRLYAGVAEDIDTLAEKAIGLGSTANVALPLHTMQLNKLLQNYGMTATLPQGADLARRSYAAEMNFLKVADHMAEHMKECCLMTRGLDNMLQGIEDRHEGNVYLLKQRCLQDIF